MFKKRVQKRLERYVKKYFKKHSPKLIVVVGSVGKTTTKDAIAAVLSTKFRVESSRGNLNEQITVPFGILGVKYPPVSLLNKFGTWRRIFKIMRGVIKAPTDVDVIIQELATDRPGEIPHYEKYLRPDMAVVTAVAPEHMVNFPGGIHEVAREELAVARYSGLTIINRDDVDGSFAEYAETTNITDYGLEGGEYRFEIVGGTALNGYEVKFTAPELPEPIQSTVNLVGEHVLKSALAAATVAAKLGMSGAEIAAALPQIKPVPGRMNPLRGVRGTTIIDDTYNSNPSAAVAALRTLYLIDAPQRVAILGSMNELGKDSAQYHQMVGAQCDPNFLDYVITIGEDAKNYLASAAKANGCQVATFPGPIFAGTYANKILEPGAVVLVKGSEDGVFAEEAVKLLLHNDEGEDNFLVRQDEAWMAKKNAWIASLRNIGQEDD
ncbi:UDP-N-acetylmuramoyl-tripeptide--D-alanyl-D-alanine ligase [Candidatus Saccharibacteria bacterium]|nr:UDP-N-acetylmuramoyl-tripeptide--D-alanyl-D-alanine ligase [Candidatus Saccharibacteria bacterium]